LLGLLAGGCFGFGPLLGLLAGGHGFLVFGKYKPLIHLVKREFLQHRQFVEIALPKLEAGQQLGSNHPFNVGLDIFILAVRSQVEEVHVLAGGIENVVLLYAGQRVVAPFLLGIAPDFDLRGIGDEFDDAVADPGKGALVYTSPGDRVAVQNDADVRLADSFADS